MQKGNKILLLMCFVFSSAFCQNEKVAFLLNKAKESFYAAENFHVNTTYKIYKGYDSTKPHEVSNGILVKKSNNIYSKINELEVISTSKYYLKINHKEKAILLNKPFKNPTQIDQYNLQQLMDYVDIGNLKENNNNWIIELKAKPITQLPFSKILIQINKKTYLIENQIFYYFEQLDFSKNNTPVKSNVKLEITYSLFSKEVKLPDVIFRESTYLKQIKGIYRGVNKYQEYEIINLKS